jgi:membrane protein CcdC involved in cytochrome C biogenesis
MSTFWVSSPELLRALVLGLILVIVLFALKVAFRLTRRLVRAGCFGILIISVAAYVLARFLGA